MFHQARNCVGNLACENFTNIMRKSRHLYRRSLVLSAPRTMDNVNISCPQSAVPCIRINRFTGGLEAQYVFVDQNIRHLQSRPTNLTFNTKSALSLKR